MHIIHVQTGRFEPTSLQVVYQTVVQETPPRRVWQRFSVSATSCSNSPVIPPRSARAHAGQVLFAGYVPVAPGQALSYTEDEFAAVTGVPALIVYGELDVMGSKASSLLHAIPDSRVLMIAGARHPAYLDEPQLFHEELLGFLQKEAVFSQ